MLTTENIKRLIAFVVLACFFLPLCQCSAKVDPKESTASLHKATEVFVPFEKLHFEDADEVVLVAVFAWPLCLWAFRRTSIAARRKLVTNSVEVLCSIASFVYVGLIIQFWGEIKFGGVMCLAAFAAHAAVSMFQVFRHFKQKALGP